MSYEEKLVIIESEKQSKCLFYKGSLDMLPLSISAIPWAILAGSMAIHAGLSHSQALGMSIFMFAGAAQLVSLGLVMAGSSTISILITVFFITAQHFIYALTMRNNIKYLPIKHRLSLGFLLTDELFAIGSDPSKRNFYYLFGAGLCFYIFWIIFSGVGVFLASAIPNLQSYHLDFSIIAIFIPLILTLIRDKLTFYSVVLTAISMFLLTFFHIQGALIIAGLFGMVITTLLENSNTRRAYK